ncbi:NADP-dependent oxidoreductase [Actinophytocola sp.]|jgi:NADPH-dependent curcumin reductase CurA|uniref:NADP-dependent oxidoreductase n=1 Tax=Actinophytocola sp. TaxID=1872138 RepID=UPI002ED7A56E
MPTTTREVHLAARPEGWPKPTDFEIVTTELPDPADGQLLVRNLYMSVDPYMRPKMNDVESYTPAYELGEALYGAAIGEVVESRAEGFEPGDLVLHALGWREHALVDAAGARKLETIPGVAVSHYLGALGATGLTAYVGLLDVAEFKAGDTVFVSGAAGAVGSMVGQIARLRGAKRVVGSAGSAEKVARLTEELNFDAAFNYRDGHLYRQLAEAAPEGIEVYFDNVGGEHLEAAIGVFNNFGRTAMCGSVSHYNATEPPPGPRNLGLVVGKRLTLRGFLVSDHFGRFPDMIREVSGWLRNGDLVVAETIVDGGLDKAVDAFLGMLRGENIGKAVVRLA